MKPRVAVHKFTSCDGCQLAFLNAGEALLTLAELVDMVHFAEAGAIEVDATVDIAFVEGSISTPHEEERIKKIREQSKYIITIGSCATTGGIQALRNSADAKEWMASVYASPDYIKTLSTSTAISQHVHVDWELWGCPVNGKQVLEAIRFLLSNATPRIKKDSECMECKRKGNVCVLITKKQPCMGPVTQLGCGSLCPTLGRACYACYGPKENANTTSLGTRFESWGIDKEAVARQFLHINNQAPAFNKAGNYFKGIRIINE
ncbi:sulfhydrogenase subunit delta [Legionella quateirensis]|uniref:Sulfhydrogenase subunit delta n=1 Tax=Legionella quateirensis TaxID=45072 RepID=A0A378KVY9_9GAMM|nr:sulfhydrogenase subunit delta [Legionella quateirensis]KTD46227.1 sulfhydrogenase subunit delta [Legionella quateirensis]STY19004.1 sulfhydrogenase subunit delta [Legionella quateirensis]